MSESLTDRKNNFRVQIRRKAVHDKISKLRANFQKQLNYNNSSQINQQSLALVFSQSTKSISSLIQNIPKLKQISYSINSLNVKYFISIIEQTCFLLEKVDNLKQTEHINDKNQFYNDLITILINISSQYHMWPTVSYLSIIKNMIIKQREMNTLWLLSNLLYEKTTKNYQTPKYLTLELIQYDAIGYCELKINSKFQQQKNMEVFVFYLCCFLSNSIYLTFAEHKRIISVIQKMTEFDSQLIDYFILDSMIDHAPYLKSTNYYLLYSGLIKRFSQIYLKKKKTKMVLKYLQFVKIFIFCEIKPALNGSEEKQSSQLDSKVARSNYERISMTILPHLTICLENRSPEVKAYLAQICSMLLVYYFPYIDIENQEIYTSIVVELKNTSISIICKYSNKALSWQIKYAIIFLQKIQQFKISKQLISQFITKNGMLNALSVLLKQKSSQIQIIRQIIELLQILFHELDQHNSQQQSVKDSLQQISKALEFILHSNTIKQEKLFNRIQSTQNICDKFSERPVSKIKQK